MKYHWTVLAADYLQRLGEPRAKAYYRCAAPCRTRRVLARELWEYKRPPPCKVCGVADWIIDMQRTKEHENKTGAYAVCNCSGAHYPHRLGSVFLCKHSSKPLEWIESAEQKYWSYSTNNK